MRGIWNTSPARLGLPGIVAGVLGSLMASSACATTYLYVGQPYTSVGYYDGTATPVSGPAPAPYGPAMRVTGSFTTNARLPANLGTLKNIGPTGLNLMNGWKFNDGLLSYADGNSALVPTISGGDPALGETSGASVSTDSLGNIVDYMFWPWAPKPPHAVGQKMDSLFLLGSQGQAGEGITNQIPCTQVVAAMGDFCGNASAAPGTQVTAFFLNVNPGKWSNFDPLPDSGQSIAGTASAAIGNVAANDGVNGVPGTVGSGGNAVVSPVGNWPSGISLDSATGAVMVAASVPAGSYSMTYQLCDSQSPLACVEVGAQVVVKPGTPPGPGGATPVPTLGEWGAIALSSLLALLGVSRLRRREVNT